MTKSTWDNNDTNDTFMGMLKELAIFDIIAKDRYFQLKKLYESHGNENRKLALNVVNTLHEDMML